MQWNKIKVSVHTVNIWHFTEMKERRKVKVEEQQKKLAFGIFEYLWICENWNILYKKWVNVLRLIPIPRECIGKKSKKYSAKMKNKKEK